MNFAHFEPYEANAKIEPYETYAFIEPYETYVTLELIRIESNFSFISPYQLIDEAKGRGK